MKVTLLVICCFFGLFLISGIVYILSKGRFFKILFHDIFEWHIPNEQESFDGCSFCSKCKLCGKEIKQDSQGNWF